MKRTDADKLTALFLEDDVISDDINDVSPFLDGLDRAWMETGIQHAVILRTHAPPSSD